MNDDQPEILPALPQPDHTSATTETLAATTAPQPKENANTGGAEPAPPASDHLTNGQEPPPMVSQSPPKPGWKSGGRFAAHAAGKLMAGSTLVLAGCRRACSGIHEWISRRMAGPDGAFEGSERDVRVESRRFVRSALGESSLVGWKWLAMLGGASQQSRLSVILLRFTVITGGGVLFSTAFYGAVAWCGIWPLAASLEQTAAVMDARYHQAWLAMEKDFPEDVTRLAKVKFRFLPDGRGGGMLRANVRMPVRGENRFSRATGELFKIEPLLPPFYHVQSSLTGQALTRVLVVASNEGRGDAAVPSDKAMDHYEYLLQHIGGTDSPLEQPLVELAVSPRYVWTRRLSGFIQISAFTLFGCLLVSVWIRAWVDYGFDGWLWRRRGRLGLRRVRVEDYFELHPPGSPDTMRHYFHRVDAAAQEVRACALFQGYALDSISLHLRREVAAAFCQADRQRLGAARAFVDSMAKAFSEKYYANTGIPRFLLWCLPTIGFVGTTIGIGDALGFANKLQSYSLFEREAGRSIVSTSISVAFDSTFVGLILSIIGMWIIHIIHQRQDGHVHEIAAEVNEAVTHSRLFGGATVDAQTLATEPEQVGVSDCRSVSSHLKVRLAVLTMAILACTAFHLRNDLLEDIRALTHAVVSPGQEHLAPSAWAVSKN